MKREKDVIRQILYYLQCRNIKAWRNQSGMIAIPQAGRRARMIHMGMPGVADIIGFLPNDFGVSAGNTGNAGKILAIECKSDKGKLSPAQAEFLESVRVAGGIAIVAREIEDVERELKLLMFQIGSRR